jgi:hypothetical protein
MAPLIFLIVVLVAAVVLFGVMNKAPHTRHKTSRSGRSRATPRTVAHLDRVTFATRWSTVLTMSRGTGNDLRNAVAEADKLLDQALKQQGLSGSTMGDRLKSARGRFAGERDTYDALWRAHKLRNALAHEVGFDLVPSQAREAIADFERALRHLGAL